MCAFNVTGAVKRGCVSGMKSVVGEKNQKGKYILCMYKYLVGFQVIVIFFIGTPKQ